MSQECLYCSDAEEPVDGTRTLYSFKQAAYILLFNKLQNKQLYNFNK